MNLQTPEPNGADAASTPSASSTRQKSRLRRTLLTAGVFALLAMVYVPTPAQRFVHPGYRFIFSSEDTSIAFFQLLLNVGFAALLGAILATVVPNISRRTLFLTVGSIAVVALGVGCFAFCQAAAIRAQSDEENAEELMRWPRASETMYAKFRNAATNWRLALRFDQARRVEKRTKELKKHVAQDWRSDPVVDLSGLPDQAPAQTPLPQTSQHASASDFAKDALKLREQALVDVEPLSEPTALHPAVQRFPWKTNIVATVFWIGESEHSSGSNGHIKSNWDDNWTTNYGGLDNPSSSARRNYIPIAFIPKQNPFYCALPYNDVTRGQFKPEAPLVIPWFKHDYRGPGQSVCRDRWIAIRKGNRTCYAQWEDCGPFRTDHFQYVFGDERPTPNPNHGAGLDVSPAVRDYLGLAPTDVIDWQFVEVRDVPPGPWRSYGENNHFVIARRQMEQNSQQNEQGPKN